MRKPVDLITANSLFDTLETAAKLPEVARANLPAELLAESAARQLLCHIAHEADLAIVHAALAAAGAPATESELTQRLNAMRERQAEQARPGQ